MKYPRIYRQLRQAGFSAQKAHEIVLDAQRKNRYALWWIKVICLHHTGGPCFN